MGDETPIFGHMHLLAFTITGWSCETLGKCFPYSVTISRIYLVHKCMPFPFVFIYIFKTSFGKVSLENVSCIHHLHFQISIIILRHQIYLVVPRRKLRQCPPSRCGTSFPQMTGRSVTKQDDLSPLISSLKDALYKVKW